MTAHTEDAASIAARVIATLRNVPDFPRPGILFKDITPVLGDPALMRGVIDVMSAPWMGAGITHVAGIESRGFIFGAPIALALGAGFIPIRKPGKLPFQRRSREYALEYGSGILEMHVDACSAHSRVLLVDDVLATGGTAAAACALVEDGGGKIAGCAFLLAVSVLDGIALLGKRRLSVVVRV